MSALLVGVGIGAHIGRGTGLHVDMMRLLFLSISFGWGLLFSVRYSFVNFIQWPYCFHLLFDVPKMSLSFHKPSPHKTTDAVMNGRCEVNPVGGVKRPVDKWWLFFRLLLHLAGFIESSKKIFMSKVLATRTRLAIIPHAVSLVRPLSEEHPLRQGHDEHIRFLPLVLQHHVMSPRMSSRHGNTCGQHKEWTCLNFSFSTFSLQHL